MAFLASGGPERRLLVHGGFPEPSAEIFLTWKSTPSGSRYLSPAEAGDGFGGPAGGRRERTGDGGLQRRVRSGARGTGVQTLVRSCWAVLPLTGEALLGCHSVEACGFFSVVVCFFNLCP